jgi:hypothetical protein
MRDDDIRDIDDRVRRLEHEVEKVSRLLYMVLSELQDLRKASSGQDAKFPPPGRAIGGG